MMEQRLRIHIRGASPYGFRLTGGRNQPVSITKLRARSKAAEAGLMEGDEVLAVNGYNCKDVSYDRLMTLVEHAGHYLDLDIIRRGAPFPGAASRDRKWSYDRVLDDVIASPTTTSFDSQLQRGRHMSSPILDFNDVFDGWDAAGPDIESSPPYVFDRQTPAAASRDRARPTWEKNRLNSDDNVSVVWNPDRSITMSLALDADDKENRVPAYQQVPQPPPRRHRNESFMMISSPPSRVISPSPSRSLTQRVWTPRPVTPPQPQRTERTAADLWLARPTPPPPPPPSPPGGSTDLSKFGPLSPQVLKIISPPSDAESLDSLSPTHLSKRKKYADSSFYDDKSDNYPTVEEQMKMARRVAQSLTSPANAATRGHRMYMRRREKSVNWTVDDTNRRRSSVDSVSAASDLYYNPTPRKATASWKPAEPLDLRSVSLSPVPRLFAPLVPPAGSEDKAKYMSAEEFERMRLFEDKTTHDNVDPQLCFNLAANLRQSDSKGGRMFAKRRDKAHQWTVENNPTLPAPQLQPSRSISSGRMRAGSLPGYDQVPPATSWTPSGQSTSSDLTIRPPMSPWDAAAQYGHVEPAFQHLNPPRSFTSTVSVSSAASAPPFIPAGGQPQSTPARQPHQHAQHSTTTSMHISRLTSPPANEREYAACELLEQVSHHINAYDDSDENRLTSHTHHHHHPQQPQPQQYKVSSPWQRDVTSAQNYRPVIFNHIAN